MPKRPDRSDNGGEPIPLGRISGLFGVQGWVKVHSDTRPRENIFLYRPWYLLQDGRWRRYELLAGRPQGKTLVARFEGVTDRDQARALIGATVGVAFEQLDARREAGEYYWTELIGQLVVTTDGHELGRVIRLMETGSNDVLVVRGERERLIPWLPDQVIRSVDLAAGRIEVDWDPEF